MIRDRGAKKDKNHYHHNAKLMDFPRFVDCDQMFASVPSPIPPSLHPFLALIVAIFRATGKGGLGGGEM